MYVVDSILGCTLDMSEYLLFCGLVRHDELVRYIVDTSTLAVVFYSSLSLDWVRIKKKANACVVPGRLLPAGSIMPPHYRHAVFFWVLLL